MKLTNIITSLTMCLGIVSLLSCQAQDQITQINLPLEQQFSEDNSNYQQNPKIQVVFALDVTGSMSGLLNTAKDKIWSIANSLSQTEGNAEISIGLVAYRDRGDEFVTRVTDLNTDLDKVYGQLMALTTGGGGDGPESVNQALYDAITKINWDTNQETMRCIFIVGDCPPHMDYPDDVKYPESCKIAREKDIVINTVLMGNNSGTMSFWTEMASLGNGDYFNTDMNAGNLAITTPFDEEIKRKAEELESTTVFYGDESFRQTQQAEKAEKIKMTEEMTVETAARRASYLTSGVESATLYGEKDLVQDIKEGKVAIEEISTDDLPEELKTLEDEELEIAVVNMVTERNNKEVELQELIKMRDEYIITNTDVETRANSFTGNVFNSFKKQADKKNIKVKAEAKY